MIAIAPLAAFAPALLKALLDGAFGADRQARTAYQVRGDARPIAALSFAAHEGDVLVGSVQCWPVLLTGDDERAHPLVMIGPVAVDPARQSAGVGQRLMHAALEAAARERRDGAMMLIGDPDYYSRFFGFSAARTAHWRLPGPVERHRLLARGPLVPDAAGALGPALAAA